MLLRLSTHHLAAENYIKQDTDAFHKETECHFTVVLDDELEEDNVEESRDGPPGRIIAGLRYYRVPGSGPHPDEGTQSVVDNPGHSAPQSTYRNTALSNDYVRRLVAARMEAMRRLGDHIIVDNLYTDPKHHRRGAGGMLMQYACQVADSQGLPAMLEASPAGRSIYEAVGFRQVDWPDAEIWVDRIRWENGGDKGQEFEDERLRKDPSRSHGWYAQVVMVRPAKVGGKDAIVA